MKKPVRPRRRSNTEGPFKKLTVTISYYAEPDGSDVEMAIRGKLLNEIFLEGGPRWNNIKDAVHDLIAEIGPLGPGRKVTIRSTP